LSFELDRSAPDKSDPLDYARLQAVGFNLLTLHDRVEALKMAFRISPKFIMLDLTAADPHVLDLLRCLRADRNGLNVPVLIIEGLEEVAVGRQLGRTVELSEAILNQTSLPGAGPGEENEIESRSRSDGTIPWWPGTAKKEMQ
jgi:hypothetical protein